MAGKVILGRAAQSRARVWRFVVTLGLLLVVSVSLQTTVLARWRLFSVVPDLTFAVVVAVAFFCGKETGAICGIAGGFLLEALGAQGVSILPLVWFLCGYLCGHFASLFPKSIPTYLVAVGVSLPIHALTTLFYVAVTYRSLHLATTLLRVILPESGALVVTFLVVGFPLFLLCRRLGRE